MQPFWMQFHEALEDVSIVLLCIHNLIYKIVS